jgi:hypothetical protein
VRLPVQVGEGSDGLDAGGLGGQQQEPVPGASPTLTNHASVWRTQWRTLLVCFLVSAVVTVVSHLVKVSAV